ECDATRQPGGGRGTVVFHGGRSVYAVCRRPPAAGTGGAGIALCEFSQGAAAVEPGLHRPARRHLLDACGAVFWGKASRRFPRLPFTGAAAGSHHGTGSKTVACIPVWRKLSGSETALRRGITGRGARSDEVRNRAQSRPVAALLQPGISVLHRTQGLCQGGGCFFAGSEASGDSPIHARPGGTDGGTCGRVRHGTHVVAYDLPEHPRSTDPAERGAT